MSSTKTATVERTLVDTCVLLEATDEARRHHAAARAFLERGEHLVLSAQVVREFLVVATRPASANGLGMAPDDAIGNIREIRRFLRLLAEEKPLLPTLLSLLDAVPCRGRNIHDAALVATAVVHRVGTIATFNVADFARFRDRVRVLSPSAT